MGHVYVKSDLKFKSDWPSCDSSCSSGCEQSAGAAESQVGVWRAQTRGVRAGTWSKGASHVCTCGQRAPGPDVPGAFEGRQQGRVAGAESGEGGKVSGRDGILGTVPRPFWHLLLEEKLREGSGHEEDLIPHEKAAAGLLARKLSQRLSDT